MRRLLTAFGFGLAFASAAFANPAMTTIDTQMRESPNAHARVVQAIPANAQIDVEGLVFARLKNSAPTVMPSDFSDIQFFDRSTLSVKPSRRYGMASGRTLPF